MKINPLLVTLLSSVVSFDAASQNPGSLFQIEMFADVQRSQLLNLKSLESVSQEVCEPVFGPGEKHETKQTWKKHTETASVSAARAVLEDKSIQEFCIDWWSISETLADTKLQKLQQLVMALIRTLTLKAITAASEQHGACAGAAAEDNASVINAFFLGSLNQVTRYLSAMNAISAHLEQYDTSVLHAAHNLQLTRVMPFYQGFMPAAGIKYGAYTFYLPGTPFVNGKKMINYIYFLLSVICDYFDPEGRPALADQPAIFSLFEYMGYGSRSGGVFTVNTGMSLGKEIYPVKLISYFKNSVPASHPIATALQGIQYDREARVFTTTRQRQKRNDDAHFKAFRIFLRDVVQETVVQEETTNAQGEKGAAVHGSKKTKKKPSNTSGLKAGGTKSDSEQAVKVAEDVPVSYAKRAKQLMAAEKTTDLENLLSGDWKAFAGLKPNQKKEIRDYLRVNDSDFYSRHRGYLEGA